MKRTLCAVGFAAFCLTWTASAGAQADHLKCYKVKDPLRLSGTLDLTSPQFGLESGCKVSSTALFCVPAVKSNVNVTNKATGTPITPLPVSAGPAGGDRVCYKVKCPKPATPIPDQSVTDQFGNRTVTKFTASLLCTPAVKGATFCGDGTIDPGEDCEGANLNGATCQSLGFARGPLACAPGCAFDTSGCSPVQLPATGQTTCWDSGGAVIPCAATGQDGDVQAGATIAYMDNGDGTITDKNTGLIWEKQSDDGTIHDRDNGYTWDDAFAVHVAGLNTATFAGHTDWRLPNFKELVSILDLQTYNPPVHVLFNLNCVPGCTVFTCSCTKSNYYWSSSSYPFAPANASCVYFVDGTAITAGKTLNVSVRAVRGGS